MRLTHVHRRSSNSVTPRAKRLSSGFVCVFEGFFSAATMSLIQAMRNFISQRLSAAAAEIFTECEKTIEEEINRQCRLLDISRRQQVDTNTTGIDLGGASLSSSRSQ